MNHPTPSRRELLKHAALGLAAAGAAALTLRAGAQATPGSGDLGAYGDYLEARGESPQQAPAEAQDKWAATEDNILGPFHRAGAPFRGKITPPLEPGDVLLITGRVWALDTRQALAGVVIDIWQANKAGRYDNDDPRNPPKADQFTNRARIITDEQGRYEYETIHPGPYKIGPRTWRPPHIHYLVRARGYKTLVTQLYFKGDPHQATDAFIKDSLIIGLDEKRTDSGAYRSGAFDIVLAAEATG